MDDKIGELYDYLSSKQQHLLTFTSIISDMNYHFPIPIQLNPFRNYKAGLLWFSAYNTIFNVKWPNQFFVYSYKNEKVSIKLPKGAYEINSLNTEIERQMKSRNHPTIKLDVDRTSSKSVIKIDSPDIIIDFLGDNTLRKLLGFHPCLVKRGFTRSQNIVQIATLSTINIECNIIQNSYINGKQSNILYSFPSYTVPVGYKIVEKISHPIYLPIEKTSSISSIRIKIVDENGEIIDFNGEEISMALEIKQV